jgi:hypothetical protein
MAGRADERKPFHLDRLDSAPCREARCLSRSRIGAGVHVEPHLIADGVDGVDVSAIVYELDLRALGWPPDDETWKALEEPLEPLRALDVRRLAVRM